jgi:hypothetical protein
MIDRFVETNHFSLKANEIGTLHQMNMEMDIPEPLTTQFRNSKQLIQ